MQILVILKTVSVVTTAPRKYRHQQGLTCGEFNARAIAEGFGVSFCLPPAPRLRIQVFGYSFIQDIRDLLEAHGIAAPVRHAAHLSPAQKLQTIRNHIDQDQPVILAIGNGHLRRGYYSPLARRFIGHFVTAYGYGRDGDHFFVYDPYLEGEYHEEIPVGNEVRTANEMLKDWGGTIYYQLIGMDHAYIAAGPRH